MGKAEIVDYKGCGVYSIKPLRETAYLEMIINELVAKRSVLDGEINTVDNNINCVESDVEALENDLNSAISSGGDTASISKKLAEKSQLLGFLRQVREELYSKVHSIEKKEGLYQEELTRCNNLFTLASCADMNESLSPGDVVGTIEYGRQSAESMGPGWRPIIQPGRGDRSSLHDPARDGIVTPAASSTPAAWLYNHIMEAGARTWRPLYRMAVIREMNRDSNTCNVTLKQNRSQNTGRVDYPDKASRYGVIDGVPIDYFCGPDPFTVGDNVVVEFRPENGVYKPYVIGFRDSPKGCHGTVLWTTDLSSGFVSRGSCCCTNVYGTCKAHSDWTFETNYYENLRFSYPNGSDGMLWLQASKTKQYTISGCVNDAYTENKNTEAKDGYGYILPWADIDYAEKDGDWCNITEGTWGYDKLRAPDQFTLEGKIPGSMVSDEYCERPAIGYKLLIDTLYVDGPEDAQWLAMDGYWWCCG